VAATHVITGSARGRKCGSSTNGFQVDAAETAATIVLVFDVDDDFGSRGLRAVTLMRRVVLYQLPSDLNAGLSLKVPHPQAAQKLCATSLVCQW
jgi:hypothetical protein